MKPLNRSLNGNGNTLPALDEHLPKAPKGYTWAEDGAISGGNWRYLRKSTYSAAVLWAVRDMQGSLCMGVINHKGYIVEPQDYDTVISVLMAKKAIKIEERSYI